MAKSSGISCEVQVAFVDMVYGIAYSKGQHVMFTPEDFERFKSLVKVVDEPQVASEKKPVKRKKTTKKSEE